MCTSSCASGGGFQIEIVGARFVGPARSVRLHSRSTMLPVYLFASVPAVLGGCHETGI